MSKFKPATTAEVEAHDHDHAHSQSFLNRRSLLKMGGLALGSTVAASFGLPSLALGVTPTATQKTLIMVFMRGAADPMFLFPPAADPTYKQLRQSLAVPAASSGAKTAALDFVGQWQLNPLLAPLLKIPNLAFVPSGGLDITLAGRSHFDTQRWIERGTTDDTFAGAYGIFNRYLQLQNPTGPFQGLAAGSPSLPTSLFGSAPVTSVTTLESFGLTNSDFCPASTCSPTALEDTMAVIANQAADPGTALGMTLNAEKTMLAAMQLAHQVVANPKANITQTFSSYSQGHGLRAIAQCLKAGVPISCATVDWQNTGNWDTHVNLPHGASAADTTIPYNASVQAGADDLLAFYNELGPAMMKNVVVLVGSEFGRCVQPNGNLGADHGKGSAWFAFGGSVAPGINLLAGSDYTMQQVINARTKSDVNYYVPTLVNCYDLIGECMVNHLGLPKSKLYSIFPQSSPNSIAPPYTFTNRGLLGSVSS